MSYAIERGLLLTANDLALLIWVTDMGMRHLKDNGAIDATTYERLRTLRRTAQQLATSNVRHKSAKAPPNEASSAQSNGHPEELTARQAAAILGITDRHVYRLKPQLGVLREKPLLLDRDSVLAYALRKRNAA